MPTVCVALGMLFNLTNLSILLRKVGAMIPLPLQVVVRISQTNAWTVWEFDKYFLILLHQVKFSSSCAL